MAEGDGGGPGEADGAAVAAPDGTSTDARDQAAECVHVRCGKCGRVTLMCDNTGELISLRVSLQCAGCGCEHADWTAVSLHAALADMTRPGGPLAPDLFLEPERSIRSPVIEYPLPEVQRSLPPGLAVGTRVLAKRELVRQGVVLVPAGHAGVVAGAAPCRPLRSGAGSSARRSVAAVNKTSGSASPGQDGDVESSIGPRLATEIVAEEDPRIGMQPHGPPVRRGRLAASAPRPLASFSTADGKGVTSALSLDSGIPETPLPSPRSPGGRATLRVLVQWDGLTQADGNQLRTECDIRTVMPVRRSQSGAPDATTPTTVRTTLALVQCNHCLRHLLSVQKDGKQYDPGPSAFGRRMPLHCSGCRQAHLDWTQKPLVNPMTGKQCEMERLEIASFGSPPWLELDPDPAMRPRLAAVLAAEQRAAAGQQTTEARRGPSMLQLLLRKSRQRSAQAQLQAQIQRSSAHADGDSQPASPTAADTQKQRRGLLFMPVPPRYESWCRRTSTKHVCDFRCPLHHRHHRKHPLPAAPQHLAAGQSTEVL